MLLLYQIRDNKVPMALINVHTGKLIQKFVFDQTDKEIEFLEQFNERIMIKAKDQNLKITIFLIYHFHNLLSEPLQFVIVLLEYQYFLSHIVICSCLSLGFSAHVYLYWMFI